MSTDYQKPESKSEQPGPIGDPFQLPEIVSVTARRVVSKKPWLRVIKGREIYYNEAVQFTVKTSGEFPMSSYSPALYVGETQVDYWIGLGENRYAFLSFEIEKLEEGAPIRLGWFNLRHLKEAKDKFYYKLENSSVR
jgi:hypothetical protein